MANGSGAGPARLFADDRQSKLPNEVWFAVFSLLHDSGFPLAPASTACKRFSVLTAPLRFRQLAFRSPPLGTGTDVEDRSARLAELLMDDKRSLGQHVRTASISSRNPTSAGGRAPPPLALRALARLPNLERLQLNQLDLTADLILALSALPALQSLVLLGCVPPKAAVLQSVKACKLALAEITIDNVMKHVYLYEDLLSLLCSPATRAFALRGDDPVPSFFLRTLGNRLTHHTLTRLEIPFEGPDTRVLGDFLAHQRSVRHLICTSKTFPRLQLAETTLPSLARFDGPDSPEAYELLARGRPLTSVTFRPLVSNAHRERLERAFRGLTHASRPLSFLSVKVSALDAQLLQTIADLFPHLGRLVIRHMAAITDDLLRELPAQIRRLPLLHRLQLEPFPPGPDDPSSHPPSHSRPTHGRSTTVTAQIPHIRAFEQAGPALRRVRLERLEWVWMDRGDWRAYDTLGEWDTPVGDTRDTRGSERDDMGLRERDDASLREA